MSGFITGAVWTPEEDTIIIDARMTGTATRYIARDLPGRTEAAVESRIRHLRRSGRIVMGVRGGGRPQTIIADVDPNNLDEFDADERASRRAAARGSARLLAALNKFTSQGAQHV